MTRIKNVNDALQRHHDDDMKYEEFLDLILFMMLMGPRKLQAEQARLIQDHQRQLEHIQKTSEANADRIRTRNEAELKNLQKTSEANADRIRKRTEAEIADLQNKVEKLNADLVKVRK